MWVLRSASGELRVMPIDYQKLRHVLARVTKWVKNDRETAPPPEVVNDMLANPDPPLPELSRIVGHPVFNKDYSLHETPGYSRASQCYFDKSPGLYISRVPQNQVRGSTLEIGVC